MQRELKLRIISGIVMAAIVLVATWQGGALFRFLSVLIALPVYYEWSKITQSHRTFFLSLIGWASIAFVSIFVLSGYLNFILVAFLIFVLFGIALAAKGEADFWFPAGIFYSGITAISLAGIRGSDKAGFYEMLFIFVVIWTTDIAAYFIGRAVGGPKLAPRISPGKTWSGAIGGTVCAILAGLIFAYIFTHNLSWLTVCITFVLSVLSQSGDLFESFVKRRFSVKDSGQLIPGHGGMMDRVDGLIFACFAAFLLDAVFVMFIGDHASLGRVLFDL